MLFSTSKLAAEPSDGSRDPLAGYFAKSESCKGWIHCIQLGYSIPPASCRNRQKRNRREPIRKLCNKDCKRLGTPEICTAPSPEDEPFGALGNYSKYDRRPPVGTTVTASGRVYLNRKEIEPCPYCQDGWKQNQSKMCGPCSYQRRHYRANKAKKTTDTPVNRAVPPAPPLAEIQGAASSP